MILRKSHTTQNDAVPGGYRHPAPDPMRPGRVDILTDQYTKTTCGAGVVTKYQGRPQMERIYRTHLERMAYDDSIRGTTWTVVRDKVSGICPTRYIYMWHTSERHIYYKVTRSCTWGIYGLYIFMRCDQRVLPYVLLNLRPKSSCISGQLRAHGTHRFDITWCSVVSECNLPRRPLEQNRPEVGDRTALPTSTHFVVSEVTRASEHRFSAMGHEQCTPSARGAALIAHHSV